MPTNIVSRLVSVSYRIETFPFVSQEERKQEAALLALEHLAGLSRLLRALSESRWNNEEPDEWPVGAFAEQRDDYDQGLHALGSVMAGIADHAYGIVSELKDSAETSDETSEETIVAEVRE